MLVIGILKLVSSSFIDGMCVVAHLCDGIISKMINVGRR